MKKLILAILMLIMFAFAFSNNQAWGYVFKGTVTKDGVPVNNMQVTITYDQSGQGLYNQSKSGRTNSNGYYEIYIQCTNMSWMIENVRITVDNVTKNIGTPNTFGPIIVNFELFSDKNIDFVLPTPL